MPLVRPTRMGQFGRWFAAVFLLAMTPLLTWVAWQMHHTANATAAWPSVEGEVIRAQLRDVGYRDGGQRFAADVVYVYRVGDRQFEGTRVRTSDPHLRRRPAEKAIAGLTVGQRRPVYHHPADPANALLIPGAVSGEAWMFLIPCFTLAGGLSILVWLIRNRGKEFVRLEVPDTW